MKKITLLGLFLVFCIWQGIAQTTHTINWQMGITVADANKTINVGDTVEWIFSDGVSHSVTSEAGSTETFDSGVQASGYIYSYTFTTAGANPYICSLHPSMAGTITVNAASSSVSLPINEDFSGGALPTGWTNNDIAGNGEVWVFNNPGAWPINSPMSDPVAILDSDDYGSGPAENAALETPAFDATSATTVQLTFDHYFRNYSFGNSEAYVEVFDGTGWVQVYYHTGSDTANPASEVIDISTHVVGVANAQVRFRYVGNWDYYWMIDNIYIGPPPACVTPINTMNTLVSSTTADFSWDAEATATDGYNWVVMADGDDPDVDTPVTGGSTNSTTYIAQATVLTANTAYDFYVQSDCGATNGTSDWSLKVDFKTACDVFSVLPFQETFNSASTTESCWTVIDNNNDGDSWNMNYTTNPFEGNQTAVFITDFNGGNNDDYLVTPTITLTGNERLKFQYRAQSSGEPNDFQVTLSTTGIAVGNFTNVLMPLTVVSNTTYQEQIIDLSAYTGNVNIAFHVPSGGLDGYRLYIDSVVVEAIPSCLVPTNIQNTAITAATADFSWDAEATATDGYNWVVMADGEDPDTDTPVTTGSVTSGTTAQATGLSSNTAYDFYVQSNCGTTNGLSTWSLKVDFMTDCVIYNAPFIETFSSGTLPTCWSQSQVSGSGWDFNGISWNVLQCSTAPTDHTTGTGTTDFAAIDFSTPDIGVVLEMPIIDVSTLTVPQLSFYMYFCTAGYTPPNELYIEAYDGSAWVQVGFINTGSGSSWEEHSFDLTSYKVGNNVQLRFRAEESTHPDRYYGDMAIDDVEVKEAPTCIKPANVQNIIVTAATADFSWDAEPNASTGYNWVVMADGDDPLVDTPVTLGSVLTGTTTAQATGLTPDTPYDFYVQSDCGSTDGLSDWSTKVDFTTDPSCIQPMNVQNTDLTTSSADFSWDAEPNASVGYNWVVMANGDDPSLDTPVVSGTETAGTTTAQTTGLTANTDYDFYVQSDCGVTDGLSDWSAKVDFYTGYCASQPSSNDGTGYGDIDVETATFNDNADSTYENYTSTPVTIGLSEVIDIQIDLNTGFGYGYDYHIWVDYNNDLVFDNTTEKVVTGATTAASDVVINESFTFSATTPGQYRMRIGSADSGQFTPNPCYNGSYGNTADFVLELVIPCDTPTGVMVSNLTANTADFTWTASPHEQNGYNWVVMADGDDPMMDTPVDLGTTATGVTTASASGLTANTAYDFYVQTNCIAGTMSDWSAVLDFTPTNLPCAEPTGVTNTAITLTTADFSWTASADETNGYIWYVMADGDDPMIDQPVKQGTTATGVTIAMVTGLNPATNYDFYVRTNCGSGNTSDWSTKLDFMTDNYPCTPPSSVNDSGITSTTAKFSWPTNGIETGGYTWVLMADGVAPDVSTALFTGTTATGVTSVIISGLTPNTNYDFYVQTNCATETSPWSAVVDITTLPPPCDAPTGLMTTNVTDTTADFSWTASPHEQNGYNWIVMADGDDPLAGTPVDSGTTATGVTTAQATGLIASTNYDLYVQTNCATGNTGDWSLVYDFMTAMPPCEDPTALNLDSATGTSLGISWTASTTETDGYEWILMADGDDPATDTPVDSGSVATGTTMVTISGLSNFTDYDFYLQANCGSGNMSNWVMLDVSTVRTDAENFSGFEYYPNPVRTDLVMKASYTISQVVVYNLLGQQVIKTSPNSMETIVDFSTLQAGAYMVQVQVNDAVKTIRIIKE